MRVIFDPKLTHPEFPPTAADFVISLVGTLADLSPEDEFILLCLPDRVFKPRHPPNLSVVKVLSGPSFFGRRFLERVRLPRLVKKLKGDLFVGIDNGLIGLYPKPSVNLLIEPQIMPRQTADWVDYRD